MEFYPFAASAVPAAAASFQFPTGWNSTWMTFVDYDQNITVSIPNGMEFYLSIQKVVNQDSGFQFPTGWNSTLLIAYILSYPVVVSIPNGMEFYVDCLGFVFGQSVSIPNGMEFYNVFFCSRLRSQFRFQFPTGWNSTYERRQSRRMLLFQFPTGWNSTYIELCAHKPLGCFNSQRDGILRNSRIDLQNEKLFQFPTGWNSTK